MIAVFSLSAIAPIARGVVIGVITAGPVRIRRERAARASPRLGQAARHLNGEYTGPWTSAREASGRRSLAGPTRRRCQVQEERKSS